MAKAFVIVMVYLVEDVSFVLCHFHLFCLINSNRHMKPIAVSINILTYFYSVFMHSWFYS